MANDHRSRRNFLKHSSIGLGAGLIDISPIGSMQTSSPHRPDLPFDINVVTIDVKDGNSDDSPEHRVKRVLRSMKSVSGLKPDIICIPEGFSYQKLTKPVTLSSIAQKRSVGGTITEKFTAFAKEAKCYVACPVITQKGSDFQSSTMLLDRKGNLAGIYDKMFPSRKEMTTDADGNKIVPGAPDQPPIKTDFGMVGFKMGNDVLFPDSWEKLSKKGVNIIVYNSSFPGGRMLNFHAVRNHCYIISSTLAEGRIIDISGNDIDKTSEFIRYSWSRINTERTNILTFPNKLPELFAKYGDRLQMKAWGSTDMLTIESRDASLRVKDVLKEFGLQTYTELITTETDVQNRYRKIL